MPFKLSKLERERRDEIAAALREHADNIGKLVDAYNAATEEPRAAIEAAVEAYNALLGDATEFAQDIATQADNDISEKSEKWQEGERGQAATQWKDEWEGLSFDDLDIEMPDELTFDPPEHADTLDGVPDDIAEFV